MSDPTDYLILGYASGLLLLWGYVIVLWGASRSLRRREQQRTNTR